MESEQKLIRVSHVNIRLSISFLLLKLVLIELISGISIILWHIGLSLYIRNIQELQTLVSYGMWALVFLVLLKTLVTVFVILQWLNEYYEISATSIIYSRGILFRKMNNFPIKDIKFIDVDQGLFGRLFNFGTITLMNIRRIEYAQMYLIHNPWRYAKVIEAIVPELVERRKSIRSHYHEMEDENDIVEDIV